MRFCLTTGVVKLAVEAEQAGIDRIMIDLERRGKGARQAGRHTFISDHRMEDVSSLGSALDHSTLMVRVNSLYEGSHEEIDEVIDRGARIVMLPYFDSADAVHRFVQMVGGRARVSLLVETPAATERLSEIVAVNGVHEIHVGLNDLAFSAGHAVIFEPFVNGDVDRFASIVKRARIAFGVGGITRLDQPGLPVAPDVVLGEQVRLGAEIGWFTRSFSRDLEHRRSHGELATAVARLRRGIARWHAVADAELAANHEALVRAVEAWKAAVDVGRRDGDAIRREGRPVSPGARP